MSATFCGNVVKSMVFTDALEKHGEFSEPASRLRMELEHYFTGESRTFSLDIAPDGSAFEQRVWQEVSCIPWGQTRSYQQIAEAIGKSGSARAVGLANSKNPCLILIPCHRVIGADGRLTGYAGGLERKRELIAHEQRIAGVVLF